jgi:hypothetical protein
MWAFVFLVIYRVESLATKSLTREAAQQVPAPDSVGQVQALGAIDA